MHRYSRMHLTPADAMRSLETIDLEEKSRIAEGIALIAVLDQRRDFLAAGYSSMRSYCMDRLRMSEDKALRRIQVARVALRVPGLFEHLADGRLTVTTAAVLAPHLGPETATELLERASFRSKAEIVQMLAERSRPRALASMAAEHGSNVEPVSCQHAPAHAAPHAIPLELCAPLADGSAATQHAPAHAMHARRGRVSPAVTGG